MNTQDYSTVKNENSIKEAVLKVMELYSYLKNKWYIILIIGLVGGLLGLTYAYFKKAVYTAECTFVLEEAGNNGLGQYSGLASIAGIDIGGGGGGLFQGENIIQLYKSRSMIQKTLLSPANFNGEKQLLIDRYIQINGLNKIWEKDSKLRNLSFDIPENKYSLLHNSVIAGIVGDINKNYLTVERPDKKLTIISVKVKSEDELFAKEFNDKIVSNVNAFYIETKTKKALENFQILQHQADSVRKALYTAIIGSAAASDANPNPNPLILQSLKVPFQRKQIDASINNAMLSELVRNVEVAKVSLRKEIPLIQLIDSPILPLNITKPGIIISFIKGSILSSLIIVLCLSIKKLLFNT